MALVDDRVMRRLNHDFADAERPATCCPSRRLTANSRRRDCRSISEISLWLSGVVTAGGPAARKTVNEHLCHLMVHGVLHLLGL